MRTIQLRYLNSNSIGGSIRSGSFTFAYDPVENLIRTGADPADIAFGNYAVVRSPFHLTSGCTFIGRKDPRFDLFLKCSCAVYIAVHGSWLASPREDNKGE